MVDTYYIIMTSSVLLYNNDVIGMGIRLGWNGMVRNKTHDNDIISMGMIPRWNGKIPNTLHNNDIISMKNDS